MSTDELIIQLYNALWLTMCDAEKNGFTYGDQAIARKAIKAFQSWRDRNLSACQDKIYRDS